MTDLKIMARIFKKGETKNGAKKVYSPEIGSAIVRIAHKISSNNSKGQVVKIENKYYRIKELG